MSTFCLHILRLSWNKIGSHRNWLSSLVNVCYVSLVCECVCVCVCACVCVSFSFHLDVDPFFPIFLGGSTLFVCNVSPTTVGSCVRVFLPPPPHSFLNLFSPWNSGIINWNNIITVVYNVRTSTKISDLIYFLPKCGCVFLGRRKINRLSTLRGMFLFASCIPLEHYAWLQTRWLSDWPHLWTF